MVKGILSLFVHLIPWSVLSYTVPKCQINGMMVCLPQAILVAMVGLAAATPEADPKTSTHHHGYFPVYAHHTYCDATVAPTCAQNSTLNYCLDDEEYPQYEIKAYVHADIVFLKKYADVPSQSADDLVDGITKEQEEGFDYSYYTGASTGDSPYDLTHWSGPEGYLCPSDVVYAMPRRARNVEGKWRVIVNDVHYYTQTARLETCLFPGAACRALAPCFSSTCTQKYIYHRLLSWDPCDPYKGLFIDAYRLPAACSCHVPTL